MQTTKSAKCCSPCMITAHRIFRLILSNVAIPQPRQIGETAGSCYLSRIVRGVDKKMLVTFFVTNIVCHRLSHSQKTKSGNGEEYGRGLAVQAKFISVLSIRRGRIHPLIKLLTVCLSLTATHACFFDPSLDPSAGLLVRNKSGANLDKLESDPLQTAGDTNTCQTGWQPVFPYTTNRHTEDLMRPGQPAAVLALVGARTNGPRLVLRSAPGICTLGKLAPGQPLVTRK